MNALKTSFRKALLTLICFQIHLAPQAWMANELGTAPLIHSALAQETYDDCLNKTTEEEKKACKQARAEENAEPYNECLKEDTEEKRSACIEKINHTGGSALVTGIENSMTDSVIKYAFAVDIITTFIILLQAVMAQVGAMSETVHNNTTYMNRPYDLKKFVCRSISPWVTQIKATAQTIYDLVTFVVFRFMMLGLTNKMKNDLKKYSEDATPMTFKYLCQITKLQLDFVKTYFAGLVTSAIVDKLNAFLALIEAYTSVADSTCFFGEKTVIIKSMQPTKTTPAWLMMVFGVGAALLGFPNAILGYIDNPDKANSLLINSSTEATYGSDVTDDNGDVTSRAPRLGSALGVQISVKALQVIGLIVGWVLFLYQQKISSGKMAMMVNSPIPNKLKNLASGINGPLVSYIINTALVLLKIPIILYYGRQLKGYTERLAEIKDLYKNLPESDGDIGQCNYGDPVNSTAAVTTPGSTSTPSDTGALIPSNENKIWQLFTTLLNNMQLPNSFASLQQNMGSLSSGANFLPKLCYNRVNSNDKTKAQYQLDWTCKTGKEMKFGAKEMIRPYMDNPIVQAWVKNPEMQQIIKEVDSYYQGKKAFADADLNKLQAMALKMDKMTDKIKDQLEKKAEKEGPNHPMNIIKQNEFTEDKFYGGLKDIFEKIANDPKLSKESNKQSPLSMGLDLSDNFINDHGLDKIVNPQLLDMVGLKRNPAQVDQKSADNVGLSNVASETSPTARKDLRYKINSIHESSDDDIWKIISVQYQKWWGQDLELAPSR